jgi:hypothetical protein
VGRGWGWGWLRLGCRDAPRGGNGNAGPTERIVETANSVSFKIHQFVESDIEKGEIKIPQFQRDFVWSIQKSAALLDSVIKGYPIGTFIFWATKDRLRSVRDLGKIKLPEPKEGEVVSFVLDGQQRITSLFATLKGLKFSGVAARRMTFRKSTSISRQSRMSRLS